MQYLSPYHIPNQNQDDLARRMEMELSAPSQSQEGLLFKEVAEILESATTSGAKKKNLVVELVNMAMKARPENPVLEVFALLRVLMPEMDITSVYGFKTPGLLKSFAKALQKSGGLSGKAASAQLLSWNKEPKPIEHGKYLITMPESAIAMAQSKCFASSHQHKKLSLLEVVAFCQKLTNIYKERHVITLKNDKQLVAGPQIDSGAEALCEVLPSFSYVECKVFVKVLLKTLPIMGIGPKTALQALGPFLESFLQVQRDLPRLAISIVEQPNEPPHLLPAPLTS